VQANDNDLIEFIEASSMLRAQSRRVACRKGQHYKCHTRDGVCLVFGKTEIHFEFLLRRRSYKELFGAFK